MRRITAVFLIGAGLLSLPACGGKTDETARAAGITPASAIAFLSVNLEPSIEQKRGLLSISKKFPGAQDEVKGDFEDARDELLGELTEEGGLDYAKDVKPWLGNEVALAVLPFGAEASEEPPPVVVLVHAKDTKKATAALEKSRDADEFDGQYRVIGDLVVIAAMEDDTAEKSALDTFVAESKKENGGLAKTDRFNSVVDELAGDRLLLAWADFRELGDQLEGAFELPGFNFVGEDAKSGPVALDLHVEKSALVVEGAAVASGGGLGAKPALTTALPVDTLAALTLFNVKGGIKKSLEAFVGSGGEGARDPFEDLENETGVNLERDVLAWLGGEIAIVASEVPGGQDFPNFAVVVDPSDQAKAEAGMANIVKALNDQGFGLEERDIAGTRAYVVAEPFFEGVQPAMALFEGRFVMANQPSYLETLSKPSSPGFGSTDAYKSVVAEGASDKTNFQLVVRIDPIREAIERALSSEERADYEKQAKANVEPLQSFGVSSRIDGDTHRFSMKLTFD